jgi:hypothetical protein
MSAEANLSGAGRPFWPLRSGRSMFQRPQLGMLVAHLEWLSEICLRSLGPFPNFGNSSLTRLKANIAPPQENRMDLQVIHSNSFKLFSTQNR